MQTVVVRFTDNQANECLYQGKHWFSLVQSSNALLIETNVSIQWEKSTGTHSQAGAAAACLKFFAINLLIARKAC